MHSMDNSVIEDEAEKPLDPAMERVRRKMIRLLAVAIGTMLIGLMAVLFAIVYKINSKPKATPPSVALTIPEGADEISGTIALPRGAQINGQSLSGGQILLDITLVEGGRELLVFDMGQKRVIARYQLTNMK